MKADYLFLMTDVDCLYTANPRTNPDARPIEVVTDISSLEADVSAAPSRSIDWRFMMARGSTAVESRSSRVVVRESFIFVARCQVGIIR